MPRGACSTPTATATTGSRPPRPRPHRLPTSARPSAPHQRLGHEARGRTARFTACGVPEPAPGALPPGVIYLPASKSALSSLSANVMNTLARLAPSFNSSATTTALPAPSVAAQEAVCR